MADSTTMIIDGVPIKLPETKKEMESFLLWAQQNGINEPLSPLHHYDNIGAWKAGINRGKDTGHFPDTFKLPNHPTFSVESKYYKKGMPSGRWEGNKYIPIDRGE